MRRKSLIPFLPAALAAVTDAVTVCVITTHQPDYPARAVVYQVVMLGAALLSADPKEVGADCGLRAAPGRGVHLDGNRTSLSSDLLCCRLGNDER